MSLSSPRASLRPRGVVFRSLSSERGPPTVTTEKEEKGGLTWRVTPTYHEPGPGLASLQHAGIALETATARWHHIRVLRFERENGSAHGVHLRQSGVIDLIRSFHIGIITLIKLANMKTSVGD